MRLCFRRRRQIIEVRATAARRHTAPATPTPMPAFAPVERAGEEVPVGLLEDVLDVRVWLVVWSPVDVEVDDDIDDDEDESVGSPEMGGGTAVTSGRCAVPVDGEGLDPGNSSTASVGAGVAKV